MIIFRSPLLSDNFSTPGPHFQGLIMGVTPFVTFTLSSIFTTLLPKLLREEFWPANRGFDSFFGFLIGAQTYFTHM